jgi:hypothetical protein
MERLKKARDEKQRKNAILERGIPKAKPLTQAQIDDYEAVKQMLVEKKGV